MRCRSSIESSARSAVMLAYQRVRNGLGSMSMTDVMPGYRLSGSWVRQSKREPFVSDSTAIDLAPFSSCQGPSVEWCAGVVVSVVTVVRIYPLTRRENVECVTRTTLLHLAWSESCFGLSAV